MQELVAACWSIVRGKSPAIALLTCLRRPQPCLQNRYSKTAKDWGWREFVSLTTLFDADAGFLVRAGWLAGVIRREGGGGTGSSFHGRVAGWGSAGGWLDGGANVGSHSFASPAAVPDYLPGALQVNDAVVFAAEVLVLRESCDIRHLPLLPGDAAATGQGPPGAAPALPAPPAASGTQPDGDAAAGRPPSAQSGGAGELVLANSSSGGSSAPGDADKSKTVFTWRIENFQAFKVSSACVVVRC